LQAGTLTAALVGRLNTGKTSLVMHLTGTTQKPVNFPGTSVELSESSVRVGDISLRIVDLPGISSLHALSRDEAVTCDYLRREEDHPDVLCAVLDASKLSVELHLLQQVMNIGLPVVVALNKQDVARDQGRPVDAKALAAALQVPVLETNALTGAGIDSLRQKLVDAPESCVPTNFDPDTLAMEVQSQANPARTWTDRLDSLLLHRRYSLLILALVMFAIFQLVFTIAEPFMTWIEAGQGWLEGIVESAMASGALRSFLVDGLINGVGSAVIFIPQIALLIGLVTLLESSGYMARAAFLLDRPLSRVGLSGRSFVPLTSSFACAIPGILASRIIPNERDRIATIVVSPLMSCSARLPVYVVLIGAFFPTAWAGLVLLGLYALGIVLAVVMALVLRRTVLTGGTSMLTMELPTYQRPAWRVVGNQMWVAVREFLVLAGTVIFATTIVIWLMSYYPRPMEIHEEFEDQRQELVVQAAPPERLTDIDNAESTAYFEQSWLARIGKGIQPVFAPAGFDWRTTVGILAAFPARELIIPTMGTLYSLGELDPGEHDLASLGAAEAPRDGLREKLRNALGPDGQPAFNGLVALALMVFFALCSQCAATLSAIRRETRSWGWPAFTFTYMTAFAWLAAVAVYQVGSLFGYGLGT
jgi:ferrous iron transport protein B